MKESVSMKPTSLDWVFSLLPIPVLGEVKAWKAANYLADQDESQYNPPFSGYSREDNVMRRFGALRGLAYLFLYAAFAIPIVLGISS